MRKILLTLVFSMGWVFAQGIILITPTTVTSGLLTPPNTNVTNDTVIYCVNDLNTIFDGGDVFVINNTASPMAVNVKRFGDAHICYTSNQFCWTICYSPTTSVSPDSIVIPAHDTSTVFHGWVDPDGHQGCCFIKYRFFSTADTNVYAEVTIKYCFANVCSQDLGLASLNPANISIYPNPAADFVTINLDEMEAKGTLVILDVNGKAIQQQYIPANTTQMQVPLSGLADGMYICRLSFDGMGTVTKKILVKH